MDIRIRLPQRIPSVLRKCRAVRKDPVLVLCAMLYYCHDGLVINDYNHRATGAATLATARDVLKTYNWEPFPLQDVVECDTISIQGIDLVLHNARTL